jgi:hypothetical protein
VWAAEGGEAFSAGLRLAHYRGSGFTTARVPAPVSLRAIGGTANQILAVGDRGFAMTYDGTFWRRVPTALPTRLNAISGDVVVGDGGVFGVFDGARISPRASGTTADLHAVWKAPNGHSWAVGSDGTIVHYDGANTFLSENLTTQTSLEGIWGTAADNIYAVGVEGVMVHYDGYEWTDFAPPPLAKGIYTIGGVDKDNFVIAGDMARAYQWNGSIWTETPVFPSPGPIRRSTGVTFGGRNSLYVTQENGSVLSISLDEPPENQSNFWEQGIGATISVGGDGNRVFAVGTELGLHELVAGTWKPQLVSHAGGEVLSKLYAATTADIYGTSNRTLVHFDGYVWSTVIAPFSATDLGGTSSNDIWIFDGKVHSAARWTGTAWTPSTVPGSPVNAFSVAPGGFVFGAGTDGALVRYANGWVDDTDTIDDDLHAVHALSSTSAFAVGAAGSIIEYSATGWASIAGPSGFAPELRAVWASSPADLFIAGVGGVAHRINGTWTVTATPGQAFNTLHGTSPTDVLAAGPAGAMLHFDGTRWTRVNTRTVNTFGDATGAGDSVYFSQQLFGGAVVGLRRDIAW